MRLVAARTIVRLERHLESQASQKVNLNKLDREKEREKKRDRNFIHLYDIIEPSLSLSLDQKQTTREGKNIRKTQNEEKYRKQWGKGDEEEERKTREWKEEREREKRTCACHTSPPSMLIRADDPIRKHAHRSRAEFSSLVRRVL